MRYVDISGPARRDLTDIRDYLRAHSTAVAKQTIHNLSQLFVELAAYSKIGRARPDVEDGLRSIPLGRYIIFYTENDDEVRIVRVLHTSRDIEAVFQDGE